MRLTQTPLLTKKKQGTLVNNLMASDTLSNKGGRRGGGDGIRETH